MTQEHEPLLLIDVRDGVGTLTLNRPRRLNALNLELAELFLAQLERWRVDPAVRVVVLRGAGRAFSAGGDVELMHAVLTRGEDPASFFQAPLEAFNRMVLALRELPQPVLAVVHGAAAGIGFNLLLACDLRLAVAGTKFTQAFVKLGLSPDGGGSWGLPRLVGHARAAELTLLPTELDAAQALAWGLVNWVVPAAELEGRVQELTQALAQGPSGALARTKALLRQAPVTSLEEQLAAEQQAQMANSAHPDFAEGVAAFVGKRPPRFAGA